MLKGTRDRGIAISEPDRILVVANRTAVEDQLLEAVKRRAAEGPATFYLLVPATPRGLHRLVDPEVSGREEAEAQLQRALPALSEAAGSEVTGEVGDSDPMAAIQDVLGYGFDEIIVSTLPRRVSGWLRVGLPDKARGLGLPVTHVRPDGVRQVVEEEGEVVSA